MNLKRDFDPVFFICNLHTTYALRENAQRRKCFTRLDSISSHLHRINHRQELMISASLAYALDNDQSEIIWKSLRAREIFGVLDHELNQGGCGQVAIAIDCISQPLMPKFDALFAAKLHHAIGI